MNAALRWALVIALVPFLSCSGSRTEILVVVDSNLIVPDQIDNVRIAVDGLASGQVVSSGALTGTGSQPLPRTVGVVHSGGPLGPVQITAEGRLGGTVVTSRVAITSFRKGKTLVLRLFLDRRCLVISCGDGSTCTDGRCVSPEVDPTTLPEWTGSLPSADAGVDSGATCVPEPETCNVLDDDCDGITDEDFDFLTDANNCGGCDNVCPTGPGADPTCDRGFCRLLCEAGVEDCNGMSEDGCEQTLDTLVHCGGCDTACALDNATTTCATTTCEIDTCDAGFDDCNTTTGDGCEQSLDTLTHCGACDTPCALDNATATCATGSCLIESCDANFDDCDTDDSTGCEADLRSDPNHCSMCGMACDVDSICLDSACRQRSEATAVGAGGAHSCAVRVTGEVVCWGDNTSGQLGDGNQGTSSPVPVLVSGITDAVAVTGGAGHSCALLATGEVMCWGDDASGQLGDGTAGGTSDVPVAVVGITDAVEVSAGGAHTCARLATGAVTCWGDNALGQLGSGGGPGPVAAGSIADAVSVAAGGTHSCAVRMGGQVLCWGDNGVGQLGIGTGAQSRSNPTAVRDIADATAVAAGTNHTCAIQGAGTMSCWGDNASGQLGTATTGGSENSPVSVSGVSDAIEVGGGEVHTCIRHADMSLSCWGDNSVGQLGDDSGLASDVPVAVMGVSDAIDLEVGALHSCVVRPSGEALCWGGNAAGQIGDNTMNPAPVPVNVMGVP